MKPTNAVFCAIFISTFLLSLSKATLLSLFDSFGILQQTPFGFDNKNRDALQLPPTRVDWKETPESHVIMVDVPGMSKDELKLGLDDENRVLKVVGERKREEEKQSDHWHRVERSYGKFWRQFLLPSNADLESVGARLQSGVLTITLKKVSPEMVKGPRVVSILGEELPAELTKSGGSKQEL